MNDRIQELWNQSKTSGVHPEFGEYDKYSAEKFAELIVEDACRALNPMLRDMISRGQAVDLIRQHFGVEL